MKIHAPWNAAFDMPYNREQALEVLYAWGSQGVMTYSSERARRVHECLTSETPRMLKAQLKYGSHLGGWAWGDAEGWHGGYETMDEAHQAYLESLVLKGADSASALLCDRACVVTGRCSGNCGHRDGAEV